MTVVSMQIYIYIKIYKSLCVYIYTHTHTHECLIQALGIGLLYFVFTLGLMEVCIKMTDKFSMLTVFKEKLGILGHCAGSLFTSVI